MFTEEAQICIGGTWIGGDVYGTTFCLVRRGTRSSSTVNWICSILILSFLKEGIYCLLYSYSKMSSLSLWRSFMWFQLLWFGEESVDFNSYH